MAKRKKIEVKDAEITIYNGDVDDHISLTDIARYKDAANTDYIIKNWLRNRNTIELLGMWEEKDNPFSKPAEFVGFRKHARLNSFVPTPKRWIETPTRKAKAHNPIGAGNSGNVDLILNGTREHILPPQAK